MSSRKVAFFVSKYEAAEEMIKLKNAYFNWSSGKDSSLALYYALKSKNFEIKSLFSVISSNEEKISMHEIRKDLLIRQADEIGIPLTLFRFNPEWSAEEYGSAMEKYIDKFKKQGITTALFGDLYLEELKNRRIANCARPGLNAEFPLWNIPPREILHQFVENGFKAIITCIDNSILPETFLGKVIDRDFIENYPENADICGENGEYHSFVFDGPIFQNPVDFHIVRKFHRDYIEPETNKIHRYCYLELE